MFYKFLKFSILSTLAFVWGGCENMDHAVAGYGCDSTDCQEMPHDGGDIACTFIYGISTNAFQYHCNTEEDYKSPDRDKKCTYDPATNYDYYKCDDGLTCESPAEEYLNNGFVCFDEQDNLTKYSDEEFYQKYYIKD